MARKSCAVALSNPSTPASDIVKLIVNEDEFQQSVILEEGIIAYPWHIDTKYYTADIHVCALQEKTLGSPDFANSVQAVIVYFDSSKNGGLSDADQWEPFVKEYDPDIRILLCDNCEENPSKGVSKLAAQEWCIARGYELVEINPEKDEEWEEEQDFLETTGIPRIVQALHAHVWPDLCMKGETSDCSRAVQSMLLNSSVAANLMESSGVDMDELLSSNRDGDEGLGEELRNLRLHEEALKNDNSFDPHILDDPPDALGSGGSTDDFFKLFQNLAEMKERVSGMTTDDRKACAEQVVKAFWQVMGGDSDELSDESGEEN
ncbi:alpha- and gamma-adaptin-binding protein p34-like [Thrips palmi]|uniref:Alpha- and gamma-adaptin-binding protein p34-like n=1 Tax=Thrips palmi TaxID=161013 RepID=A0A6P8YSA2_THRPL|nr:alpha- and gamma-adaptin-binding protein p34-like [Thrips palmi]